MLARPSATVVTAPNDSIRTSSLRAATGVAFGAAARASIQTSRCAPMSTRRTLLVAQNSTGIPIRSAYQRFELFAASAIELETRPSMPSDSAASSGVSEAASDASPSPATQTRARGSSQMKSLYASEPAMIPPPTSLSRSTASNAASTDSCRSRSTRARSASAFASTRIMAATRYVAGTDRCHGGWCSASVISRPIGRVARRRSPSSNRVIASSRLPPLPPRPAPAAPSSAPGRRSGSSRRAGPPSARRARRGGRRRA